MKLLDTYLSSQQQLYDYFGYKEDWVVIPIEDTRGCFWRLDGDGTNPGDAVIFADTEQDLDNVDGSDNYYMEDIYTQRFLEKWVYRGKDYTMVCCDTRTDGNKFLRIFDNAKERP